MVRFVSILLPLLSAAFVLRITFMSIQRILRLGLSCIGGLLCLWLLNSVSAFTGITISVNVVTVVSAGLGGLPAIAVMTLLTVLT